MTGSNKTLLQTWKTEGSEEIIKGLNIYKYKITASDYYCVFDTKKFQQVADSSFYKAKEKLVYRFISDTPVFALDTKQRITLNSANILIPKVPGYSIYYILAVLNSSAISFYYKKTFKNVKVLRSYLEALPIPCCKAADMEEIAQISKKLCDNPASKDLYSILDKKISKLYGISEEYSCLLF